MPRTAAGTRVKTRLLSPRTWGLVLISVIALGIAIYTFAGPPPTKRAVTRSIPHSLTQEERDAQKNHLQKQAEAAARAKAERDKAEIDAIYDQQLKKLEEEREAARLARQKAGDEQKLAEDQAKAAEEAGEAEARAKADKESQAAKAKADAQAQAMAALDERQAHLALERNASISKVELAFSEDALSGFGSVVDAALLELEAGIISRGAQTVLDEFCANTEPFPLDMQTLNHVDLDQVPFSVLDARRSSMYLGEHECVGLAEAGQEAIAPQAYMLEDSDTAMRIGAQALLSLNATLPALQGVALDRAGFMATRNGSSYPCCSRVVMAIHPVFGVFYRALVPVKRSAGPTGGAAVPVCFRRRWWPLPDSQAVNPVTARIMPFVDLDKHASLSTQQVAEAAAVGAGTARLPRMRPTLPTAGIPTEPAASDSRRVVVVMVAEGSMLHLLPGALRSVTRSARVSLRHVSVIITMVSLTNPSLPEAEVRSRVTRLVDAVNAHTGAEAHVQAVFPYAATPDSATVDELEGELLQAHSLVRDWTVRMNLPFGRSIAQPAPTGAARRLADAAPAPEQRDSYASIVACRPVLAVLKALSLDSALQSTARVVVLDALVTRVSPSLLHEAVNYVTPGHTVWSPIPSTLGAGEEDDPRPAGVGGWDGVASGQDPTGDIYAVNSTHAYTEEEFWSVGILSKDIVLPAESSGADDDDGEPRRLRSLAAANKTEDDDADDDDNTNIDGSAASETDAQELGDHGTGFGIDTLPNSHASYVFTKADLALAITATDILGIHTGDMCDSESVGRALLVGAEAAGLRVLRVSSLPLLMASDMHGEDGALCPDGPAFHSPSAAYCGRAWSRSIAEYDGDGARVRCGLAQILRDETLVDFHQVRVPAKGGAERSRRRRAMLSDAAVAHSVTSALDPASGLWIAASLHTDAQEEDEARFEFLFPLSEEAWSCTTCGAVPAGSGSSRADGQSALRLL